MERLAGKEEVTKQSIRAYKRWKSLWHENAAHNKAVYTATQSLIAKGAGKGVIIFGFGPSFSGNAKQVSSNNLHHQYDVICVDKALKGCIENKIIPNYVLVADAQVSFEKYGTIAPELCKRITLLAAITANYKWAEYWRANGGTVQFIINKDGIRTHKVFSKYLDPNKGECIQIPAASNVFNAAYVFATLVLKYSEVLLCGADYSFKLKGTYYGDASKPVDTNWGVSKKYFTNHYTMLDVNNELVQVSHNMSFSARWLTDFINMLGQNRQNLTINCTGAGILAIPNQAKILEKEVNA